MPLPIEWCFRNPGRHEEELACSDCVLKINPEQSAELA
jgi:hypothetical protein